MTQKHVKLSLVILLSAAALFSTSCRDRHFEADISNIEASTELHRFDKELRVFDIESSGEAISHFKETYDDFFEIFSFRILTLGHPDSLHYAENLYSFVLYNEAEGIFDACEQVFGDFSQQEQELEGLFKYFRYYFPQDTLPQIITYVSGFNQSVVTVDKYLGIALDKYLGAESKYYSGVDNYMRRRMDKAYIPVDVAAALSETINPLTTDATTMFHHMIHKGRQHYFINSMLPQHHDTLRWIYTPRQLDWAQRHEHRIWNHLAEDQLLFSSDRMKIRQYTEIAPFTIPLTDVSAPRAAVFVGYKIVLSYMKNNPHVSLRELMYEDDFQKILSQANYHP